MIYHVCLSFCDGNYIDLLINDQMELVSIKKLFRDAPLDIWGGPRVFVASKLFFYLREKTFFFLGAINVRQFFFMFL